jgi:hypothetical protein
MQTYVVLRVRLVARVIPETVCDDNTRKVVLCKMV